MFLISVSSPSRTNTHIGSTVDLHCTAVGKCYLATHLGDKLEERLPAGGSSRGRSEPHPFPYSHIGVNNSVQYPAFAAETTSGIECRTLYGLIPSDDDHSSAT